MIGFKYELRYFNYLIVLKVLVFMLYLGLKVNRVIVMKKGI